MRGEGGALLPRNAIHAVGVLLGLDDPRTQTTGAEREALRRHAEGRRCAVEIGVFEGANTARIAAALAPGGVLYAVDPFIPGRLGICWGRVIAVREVRRAGVADRVRFVEALSWDAAGMIDGEFDLVFLDADHGFDAVRRDWEDWSDRVAADGVFLLHDTQVCPGRPEVETMGSHRFFHSVIVEDPRFELVEVVDSLSVLRRKGDE